MSLFGKFILKEEMGTEHYDCQNKTEISTYYLEKMSSLITDPQVSKILQQEGIYYINRKIV